MRPVYIVFKYCRPNDTKLSRGHDLAKAFNYILKRWASSPCSLRTGRAYLLSNAAERSLRNAIPVALIRASTVARSDLAAVQGRGRHTGQC